VRAGGGPAREARQHTARRAGWRLSEGNDPPPGTYQVTGTSQGGAANFRWLMCFKPSRKLLPADQTALMDACDLLLNAGIIFDVVLWQEPNGKDSTDFSSGAEYVQYVNYYRPYVPSGLQVIYDCAGSATTSRQLASSSRFPSPLADSEPPTTWATAGSASSAATAPST